MYDTVGTVDNFNFVPSPVLDASQPKGYRIEQRLQVSLKSAVNEKSFTVEFRLGEDSLAPAEQQLNAWLESGELVQAFCSGLSARPFIHRDGKSYGNRGTEREINGEKISLDAFVVFAGVSMAPLTGGPSLEEVVKQVRGAFKRQQRQFRVQRNAERTQQLEAQLEERAQKLLERQAQQEADKASAEPEASAANGRKR
jgi:hypothetical protein